MGHGAVYPKPKKAGSKLKGSTAEDSGVRVQRTAEKVLSDADFERAIGCSRTAWLLDVCAPTRTRPVGRWMGGRLGG